MGRRRHRDATALLGAAVLAVAVLLPATPAAAATVSVSAANELTFRAAAGEANHVSVEFTGAAVVVRDAGAALTPRRRCRALDAHAARCTFFDRFFSARFLLGDGNDRLDAPRAPGRNPQPTFAGGRGDDELTGIGYLEGGAGDDRLTGTSGAEDLDGGAGSDVLRGLGGDDNMTGDPELVPSGTGGPKSPDVLDGGDGDDLVEYTSRRAPLTIDLTTGVGGRRGEGDMLIGVEGAAGGDGADTITGTEDANFLDGAGGRDTLVGLGGPDGLAGGERVDAGPGDDLVLDPGRLLICGAGDDLVDTARAALPDDAPALPADCERVQVDLELSATAHPRVEHGAVVLGWHWTCECRAVARFSVTARRHVLARGRARLAEPGRGVARLALTADGRRLLRRARNVTITLRSTEPARTRWRAVIGPAGS